MTKALIRRFLGLCCFGALLAVQASSAPAIDFDPNAPPAGFPFRIANALSGLCWDVERDDFSNGTNIQQCPCHEGRDQLWTLEKHPDDAQGDFFWVIRSVGHADLCIGRTGGGGITIQSCAAGQPPAKKEQRWTFVRSNTAGLYLDRISRRDGDQCITVPNGSLANTQRLAMKDCNADLPQSWLLLPARSSEGVETNQATLNCSRR